MIRFTTETGSVYELDWDRQLIRRTSGNHPVTRNQRGEGQWRRFQQVVSQPNFPWQQARANPQAGERLLIIWGREPDTPEVLRRTVTSEVTKVEAVDDGEETPEDAARH